jgi:hypothetical protein
LIDLLLAEALITKAFEESIRQISIARAAISRQMGSEADVLGDEDSIKVAS